MTITAVIAVGSFATADPKLAAAAVAVALMRLFANLLTHPNVEGGPPAAAAARGLASLLIPGIGTARCFDRST